MLLVRHGQQATTEFGALGRGDLYDPPLSEHGVREAEAVAARLAQVTLGAVYTSPLQRARATAAAITRHHQLTPIVRPEIREVDLWERLPPDRHVTDEYAPEALGELWRTSAVTRTYAAFPHAEDIAAFKARVEGTLGAIAAAHPDERVAVSCHGGVINAYLSRLFESPLDSLVTLRNASITVVRVAHGRPPLVLSVNDTAHLGELDG